MKTKSHNSKSEISRRDSLKLSGLALGGMTIGIFTSSSGAREARAADEPYDETQQYSYFNSLDEFYPGEPLDPNEMRITFMGSSDLPPRLKQSMMSIFVEVGNVLGESDQFVFDCGSGVVVRWCINCDSY